MRRHEAGYREYQQNDREEPSPRLGRSAEESRDETPPHDARSTPRGRFVERNSVALGSSTALSIARFRVIRQRVVFVAGPPWSADREVVLCPCRVQQIGSMTETLTHRRRRRECFLERTTTPRTMAVAGVVGRSLRRRRHRFVERRCGVKRARAARGRLHLGVSPEGASLSLRFSLSLCLPTARETRRP